MTSKTLDPNKYTFSLNGNKNLISLISFDISFSISILCCLWSFWWQFFVGRTPLTLEEIATKLGGGYNPLLQTSLPKKFRGYDPDEDTAESSHKAFITTFPRGFALEVLQVYSGPPVIVYKFRHWGFMEGPFKGHAPTGEMVEFYGMAIFEVFPQNNLTQAFIFFALYLNSISLNF